MIKLPDKAALHTPMPPLRSAHVHGILGGPAPGLADVRAPGTRPGRDRRFRISDQTVKKYVAGRRPEIWAEAGRGPENAFVPQSHRPGAEGLCGYPHRPSYAAGVNMRRWARPGRVLAGRSGAIV